MILKFDGKNLANLDFFTKSDPFLVLSRATKDGLGFTRVRKTETIRNNLNLSWKELYIATTELSDDDYNAPLNIEVYDEDLTSSNNFIDSVQLSLNELQGLAKSGSPIVLKKGVKDRGHLVVRECQIEQPCIYSIIRADYVRLPAQEQPSLAPAQGFLHCQYQVLPFENTMNEASLEEMSLENTEEEIDLETYINEITLENDFWLIFVFG